MKNNNEIWKSVTIKGFKDQYMVSNLGRIMRLTRIIKDKFKGQTRIRKIQSKILKPGLKENGYLKVSLHNQQLDKNCYVHRLVAQAFIPNPNKLPQINLSKNLQFMVKLWDTNQAGLGTEQRQKD